MKEKILALLQAQFAGVRKDGLNHIANVLSFQVDTEEKAKEVVGKLTADHVNSFIADWRKEADAEISKANKTYEDGLRKKYDFTEKKTEPANPTQPEPDKAGNFDAAAFQKMFNESMEKIVKPLQETIASLKGEKTKETRLQALNDKLKDCNDANLKAKALKDFARMTFDTDEAFNEYLAETEADVKTANQNVADSGLSGFSEPLKPNTPPSGGKEATEAEITAVMDKLPI
jgi:alpha-galactosidase/6-phospho-beta-glucosidase family protein